MRRPTNKRHKVQRLSAAAPDAALLTAAAGRARYLGSVEHKDSPSAAGVPHPRADAFICDHTDFAEATDWLRQGIRRGCVGDLWEHGFPRYVFHRVGDALYLARHLGAPIGGYKGWRLAPDEWPPGFERRCP
jgi:hypothetical protein